MKSEREEMLSRRGERPCNMKKAYKPPVILGYGTIAKLTQGAGGTHADMWNMTKMSNV